MTDLPTPEEPQEAEQHKGRGCYLGGLATVGALIGGAILGGIIAGVAGAAGAAAVPVLAIALMVGAGFHWRETPGFLLGIGLTIGISLAIGTACSGLFLV